MYLAERPSVALMGRTRKDAVRTKRLRKRARRLSARSARGRTKIVEVSHPSLPGHTERVHRVSGGLEAMYRAKLFGREPLGAKRRYEVAIMWRAAWDKVSSSVGGAMDFDRVRHRGLPGQPFAVPYMMAAQRLREATNKLYAADHQIGGLVLGEGYTHRIVRLVLGEGYTIADVARLILDYPISKVKVEKIGERLRYGLDALADLWLGKEGPNDKAPMRTWRPRASIPRESTTRSEFIPTRVAHATRMGVKMTGG